MHNTFIYYIFINCYTSKKEHLQLLITITAYFMMEVANFVCNFQWDK